MHKHIGPGKWRHEYDYSGIPVVASYSISARVSMRYSSGIDYFSSDSGDPIYVHFSPDATAEEIGLQVKKAVDVVVEKFLAKRAESEAKRILKDATPGRDSRGA